jgi:hypothetical protein
LSASDASDTPIFVATSNAQMPADFKDSANFPASFASAALLAAPNASYAPAKLLAVDLVAIPQEEAAIHSRKSPSPGTPSKPTITNPAMGRPAPAHGSAWGLASAAGPCSAPTRAIWPDGDAQHSMLPLQTRGGGYTGCVSLQFAISLIRVKARFQFDNTLRGALVEIDLITARPK